MKSILTAIAAKIEPPRSPLPQWLKGGRNRGGGVLNSTTSGEAPPSRRMEGIKPCAGASAHPPEKRTHPLHRRLLCLRDDRLKPHALVFYRYPHAERVRHLGDRRQPGADYDLIAPTAKRRRMNV